MVRFSLIFAFDGGRRARFVFIREREVKLVIILVSVNARTPLLDMKTDETRHEQGMNDFRYARLTMAAATLCAPCLSESFPEGGFPES